MPDINKIDVNSLPTKQKEYLELEKDLNQLAESTDDAYLLRVLINKVNELITKINSNDN